MKTKHGRITTDKEPWACSLHKKCLNNIAIPNIDSDFSDESVMRDLHCSCWLLTTKKLQKESKFRRGKSSGCDQRGLLVVSHPWRIREQNIVLRRSCREDIKLAATVSELWLKWVKKWTAGVQLLEWLCSQKVSWWVFYHCLTFHTKSTELSNNNPVALFSADVPIHSSTPKQAENCPLLLALSVWACREYQQKTILKGL